MNKKKISSSYIQRSVFTPISMLVMKSTKASILFFTALILFGLLSYTTLLRKEGFPAVSIPISVGAGQYFVGDASKVDADVTQPLYHLISSIDGVKNVSTTADENTFNFRADLDSSLPSSEANVLIEKKINDSGILPESAAFRMISIDGAKLSGEYDLLVSLYSYDNLGIDALQAEAEKLATAIEGLGLVSQAQIENQFTVDPTDETKRFKSTYTRAYDTTNKLFRNSVTIGVIGYAGSDFDAFDLDKEVDAKLEVYNASNSVFGAEKTADLTTSVSQDIASLQSNVIMGAIVVTIISAILISWRVSVLTAFFIVAVLLVSSAVLLVIGYTLNTITLFSLVLALGLFVDDATIIAEAIYAKKDKKKKPVQVIKEAIDSIGTASFSGTLTTALVFSPLLFITGILGDFIFQMPMTVIISLLVSFVLSITLIPLLANYTILGTKDKAKNRSKPLSDFLASTVMLIKTNPAKGRVIGVLMIGFSLILISASIPVFNKLGSDIFPSGKDGNELVITVNFPDDTTLPQAEVIVDEVSAIVAGSIGDNLSRAIYGAEVGSNEQLAAINVELVQYNKRDVTSVQIVNSLDKAFENYTAAEVTSKSNSGGPPGVAYPLLAQISVTGEMAEAKRLVDDVLVFVKGYESEQPNGDIVRYKKSELGYLNNVVRNDGTQIVELRVGFDAEGTTGVVDSFTEAIQAEFNETKLASYSLTTNDLNFDLGQESDFAESFNALPMAALGALVIMAILLGIQFRSFFKPFLILLALPFSLFGIATGLYTTDNPLSFFAMIGIIGLIGIAVNNTILLVDNATHHQKDGMDATDAMAQAIRDRFRPLTTTTLTTVAAMLPLALTNPFWEALSFTIIFGLVSSTLLVLVSFPYYYLAADFLSRTYGYKGLIYTAALVASIVLSVIISLPVVLLVVLAGILLVGYELMTNNQKTRS